jgi:hypothetical protein
MPRRLLLRGAFLVRALRLAAVIAAAVSTLAISARK